MFHDIETGEERQSLPSPTPQAVGDGMVAFSPDGRQLARVVSEAGADRSQYSIEVWDATAKRKLTSISIPSQVTGLAFSPDGGRIATASGGLKIWNLSTGKVEREIDTSEFFTDVAYSPDGKLLAGATFAGWIGLWDPATGVRGKTLSGHRGEIHRIRFQSGRTTAGIGRQGPGGQDLGRPGREPSSGVAGA